MTGNGVQFNAMQMDSKCEDIYCGINYKADKWCKSMMQDYVKNEVFLIVFRKFRAQPQD